jgi:hypothetical protein
MRRETGLFLLSPVRSDFKKNRTYITGNPLLEKGAIVEIACRILLKAAGNYQHQKNCQESASRRTAEFPQRL